jgi:hypothetical protein
VGYFTWYASDVPSARLWLKSPMDPGAAVACSLPRRGRPRRGICGGCCHGWMRRQVERSGYKERESSGSETVIQWAVGSGSVRPRWA